jgi:hypothetical protein
MTSSAKRNSGRKSTLTERDDHILRKIVSKNRRSTAAQVTAEPNIHLEDAVSTKKTVQCELHIFNIHGTAAIAKPVISDSNIQTRKRWCYDHKAWTSHNWKRVIWLDDSSFTLFPASGGVLRLENTQGRLQSGMPGSNSETRKGLCDGLGSNIVVFCWSRYYPSWSNYCK